MSLRGDTCRISGSSTSAGSQPTSPLGHFAHFQPLYELMSQAPGRTSRSLTLAPAASSMAFDPRGRSSWRYGSLFRISGTGKTSIGGNGEFAEPCRPSIQATWGRANSGTSFHGTPADVRSGPPSEATFVSLFFDIKKPPTASRGGLTFSRCNPFRCRMATSPFGIHLAREGRLARASAQLMMHVIEIIATTSVFKSSSRCGRSGDRAAQRWLLRSDRIEATLHQALAHARSSLGGRRRARPGESRDAAVKIAERKRQLVLRDDADALLCEVSRIRSSSACRRFARQGLRRSITILAVCGGNLDRPESSRSSRVRT